MPANPMQKKARNAFILGMLLTFILILIIGGLAYYFLVIQKNKQKEKDGDVLTYAYRLKRDVRALETITNADVEAIAVSQKAVPKDSFASKTKAKNQNGKEEWKAVGLPGDIYAKVALKAGTIIGDSLVVGPDESYVEYEYDENGEVIGPKGYKNDIRYVEYNMLTLGTDIEVGDFVDIRITFPNGQDLIIVVKKEIKSILGNTVGFEMTEGEIELMQSAIVESYIIKASKLYVTKYVDAGAQGKVIKSYSPTNEVRELMEKNSQIIDKALRVYDSKVREFIDGERGTYSASEQQNIETGIQQEIQNAQKARQAYLDGADSY